MSFIEVNKVWKEYTETVVLENVSLKVEKGEFFTIVGASGSGKSTFLRMILGEETPTKGKILLEGKPLLDEPSKDRGVVFQKYSVFPHLTALENVMLGLELESSPWLGKLWGTRKKVVEEQAKEMLDSVGLSHVYDQYPSMLSGGMQQRLAIAQALIQKPKILLLDEPFGALDPGIRKDMHALVLQLWKETGITIMMVTHDLQEGFYLGTRLLVFDKVRFDPQASHAFGATITYDIPLRTATIPREIVKSIETSTLEHNNLSRRNHG